MPSGFIDYVIDPLSVAASSASNLWMFNAKLGGLAPAALRWNGKAWRLQKLPAWVIRRSPNLAYYAQAAVFGPNSVWVFGIGAGGNVNSSHLAARYNGHTWIKVPLPAEPLQVSALAP